MAVPTKNPKRLVIDTSVTRSAGETENPTSINCRRVLETILEEQHLMVISDDILEEWNRHRSRFSQRWLLSIFARKLIHRVDDTQNETLREKVEKAAKTEKDRKEMIHDIHLIEAAIATDKTIISLNETDRLRFKAICNQVGEIKDIIWANPNTIEEKCIEWLQQGALPDEHRKLGFQPPD